MTLVPRTVVCAALNFRATLEAHADAFLRDPHKQPPRAPVLYFKPLNTQIGPGEPIPCPKGVDALRMGGTLGIVVARRACRVRPEDAASFIAGFCAVNDVSIPHTSYYRPAIKERCRDGFNPLGAVSPLAGDPNQLAIRIFVNGELRAENTTANLVRSVERLLADVTEFMTLVAGDVLVVGEPDNAPLARVGDRVRIEIPGLGALENSIVSEAT
jgi:5-oxopent-3-ene-1,2,5-tricarboxylate decarboxylase / 2-hydroxyhepta-2,4-diene-1,7-dioate isomerase